MILCVGSRLSPLSPSSRIFLFSCPAGFPSHTCYFLFLNLVRDPSFPTHFTGPHPEPSQTVTICYLRALGRSLFSPRFVSSMARSFPRPVRFSEHVLGHKAGCFPLSPLVYSFFSPPPANYLFRVHHVVAPYSGHRLPFSV